MGDMKRLLPIILLLTASFRCMAQNAVDFASRFTEQCVGDTALQCVTVSPKMMEQLTRRQESEDSQLTLAIQKLKSARIVTASTKGEFYFRQAEDMLKKNNQRFQYAKSYMGDDAYGSFYQRQDRNKKTVELILLHCDIRTGKMVLVNLTGDIDEEFIECLAKRFGGDRYK